MEILLSAPDTEQLKTYVAGKGLRGLSAPVKSGFCT